MKKALSIIHDTTRAIIMATGIAFSIYISLFAAGQLTELDLTEMSYFAYLWPVVLSVFIGGNIYRFARFNIKSWREAAEWRKKHPLSPPKKKETGGR